MVESPVVESKVEAEDMKIDDNPAITDDNSAKTMKKRSTSVRFEDLIDDEKGEEPMTSSSTTEQTNQEADKLFVYFLTEHTCHISVFAVNYFT